MENKEHLIHIFPSGENTNKHRFKKDCWCDPIISNLDDYEDLEFMEEEQIDHIVVEHNEIIDH